MKHMYMLQIVTFNYGRGENDPIEDYLWAYCKNNPNEAIKIERDKVHVHT